MAGIFARVLALLGAAFAATAVSTAQADIYRAGPRVDLPGMIDGNAYVAGGRVDANGVIRGDLMAAGGLVEIDGQIRDAARVAGGRLLIAAQIGGALAAAGGSIRIAPGTHVAGEAWLAGGHIEVDGWTAGDLRAVAGSVVISGEVLGNVDITAGSIDVLPDAVIRGRLLYRSTEPANIDPAARVEGEIVRAPVVPLPSGAPEVGRAVVTGFSIAWTIGLLLFGAVLVVLFPLQTIEAARLIAASPGRSLLLGFALLVATPVAAAIVVFTIFGLPLGLVLLAIYLASLVIGYLTTGFFLGDLALRLAGRGERYGAWWRIGSLVLALVVLGLLRNLPWVGGFILWAAIALGLGAWYLRLWERYRTA